MSAQLPLPLLSALAASADDDSAHHIGASKVIEHFEIVAEAEGGTKRLRELILDLAVRGALVPQLREEGTSESVVQRLASSWQRRSAVARIYVSGCDDNKDSYH